MNKKEFAQSFAELLLALPGIFFRAFSRESLYHSMLHVEGLEEHSIHQGFRNMERRGIIKKLRDGNYHMTSSGRQWLKRASLRYFRNRHPAWDGKWRVVIFDIPQELHAQRTSFQKRLKAMGFQALQKSVYVLPYPCEEEIGDICAEYRISPYVDIIIAGSIGSRDTEMKKCFTV